jgi:hypothetical protein
MYIWDILLPFDTFVFVWYIFSGFGIMYQEKSGNPGGNQTGWKQLIKNPEFSGLNHARWV